MIHNAGTRQPRGFTFVEMLAVIGILIVIIGILLPMLHEGQERALDVRCATNIRALGLAMLGYGTDHSGRYSQWNQTFRGQYYDAKGDPKNWPITRSDIFQYTGNDHKVYVCPLYDRFTSEKAAWTYTQNWALGPTGGWGAKAVKRLANLKNPAAIIVFAEESPWVHGLTAIMNEGAWDVSGSGYYARYAMNDGRIVSPGKGRWPRVDTMGTFHQPLRNRYNYELVAAGYNTVAPYIPKDKDDVRMNTGVSNVSFADGHVRMALSTNSSLLMENDQERVVYRQD